MEFFQSDADLKGIEDNVESAAAEKRRCLARYLESMNDAELIQLQSQLEETHYGLFVGVQIDAILLLREIAKTSDPQELEAILTKRCIKTVIETSPLVKLKAVVITQPSNSEELVVTQPDVIKERIECLVKNLYPSIKMVEADKSIPYLMEIFGNLTTSINLDIFSKISKVYIKYTDRQIIIELSAAIERKLAKSIGELLISCSPEKGVSANIKKQLLNMLKLKGIVSFCNALTEEELLNRIFRVFDVLEDAKQVKQVKELARNIAKEEKLYTAIQEHFLPQIDPQIRNVVVNILFPGIEKLTRKDSRDMLKKIINNQLLSEKQYPDKFKTPTKSSVSFSPSSWFGGKAQSQELQVPLINFYNEFFRFINDERNLPKDQHQELFEELTSVYKEQDEPLVIKIINRIAVNPDLSLDKKQKRIKLLQRYSADNASIEGIKSFLFGDKTLDEKLAKIFALPPTTSASPETPSVAAAAASPSPSK